MLLVYSAEAAGLDEFHQQSLKLEEQHSLDFSDYKWQQSAINSGFHAASHKGLADCIIQGRAAHGGHWLRDDGRLRQHRIIYLMLKRIPVSSPERVAIKASGRTIIILTV
ncbi:protein phosphatase 1 regulatory subunit 3E-like [Platysternon megacephalum]|uniref:Protein phosphatase 1 regulatory subunit 3E-like n=1 Tax=Platysternon megacephalum TaxID=55544 RepID=A0A4D9EKV9_9SAUR|nr:protein phosphatase 1 regulatory subunit 3E-like [Platysternon megacephalum]